MRRFAFACTVLAACAIDTVPAGLRATPPGDGPVVVFDLSARPLPDIPAPNDVATFADPSSRTGRRIDASLVAPTRIERAAREQFDEMEGWGTFAPVTVRFRRGPHVPSTQPAIDVDDVRLRMSGDGFDTSNDPIYLVNLTTGVPMLLDVGSGAFPMTVVDPHKYFPNDPRVREQNLMIETAQEGSGLTQVDYRPDLDEDFDGVLDHPDVLGAAKRYAGIDDLMTWYERETDTLILQPMLPLDEKTEYAVVVTDRLHGPDGQPARSPLPFVHHPQQRAGVAKLQSILGDGSARKNYYGDLAGSGLDHVAFAWTFTTQPVQEDMMLLRDGIYGKGPFARFASDFPPSATRVSSTVGKTPNLADEPPGWQDDPKCAPLLKTPYVVHWSDAKDSLGAFLGALFPLSKAQLDMFEQSLSNVDYIVVGTIDVPYLVGDPQSPDVDLHFHVNFQTGDGDVRRDRVPFAIAIPKATAEHKPPFPVAYWRHGTGIHKAEMLVHAGNYAKQGIALASMDAPGHGLVLDRGQNILLTALLKGACLGPFATGLASGRAIDLNGDGTPDSGGLVWSAHLLHTRDGMRQSVLEGVAMTRVLKGFDGSAKSGQDFNGDGDPNDDLAGDFNGDGVVDVGGPSNHYFSSGGSFGGLVAQIHGAIDPSITASAPVSGGGGFVPIAVRSNLTPEPVLGQVMGPLVVAVPASARPPSPAGPATQCYSADLSVRWVVDDLLSSKEIEIACLRPGELRPAMTVVVSNISTAEKRCARTRDVDGGFRVPVPASVGDKVDIQVYGAADVVDSYATCDVIDGSSAGRHITTWEQPATAFTPVADDSITCDSDTGCQQFRETFYPIGSPLVAPQEGLGLNRQSPPFRKLMNLAQAALDPADPINFAKLYMLAPPRDWDNDQMPPRPIVDVHTVGDNLVPTATGMAFSRAAGALPFLPPAAAQSMPEYADWATPQPLWDAWGKSPMQVMVDTYEMEGLSRLARTPLPPACGVNYVTPTTADCNSPPPNDADTCARVLSDGDFLGESMQKIGQPHPDPPLRLARLAGVRVASPAQLAAAWAPRIVGKPFAPDDGAWSADAPLVGMINAYLQPLGQHDWAFGDPCQAWDGTTYMDSLLVRFFATGGKDLYYLSHPASHECLATQTCSFLR